MPETPTLCGTEISGNGTLAVLAYAYFRKWECPPPPGYHFHVQRMAPFKAQNENDWISYYLSSQLQNNK